MTLIRELQRRNVIRMAGPMLAPPRKDPRYPSLRKKVGFTE
jgi:hypothetical protein